MTTSFFRAAIAGLFLLAIGSSVVWAGGGYSTNTNTNTNVTSTAPSPTVWSKHDVMLDLVAQYREDRNYYTLICQQGLDAATTEEQRVTIRANCKAYQDDLRSDFRADIRALFRTEYASVLINIRARLSTYIAEIQTWPAQERAELKASIMVKLDAAEDKAIADSNSRILLLILAIREVISQI